MYVHVCACGVPACLCTCACVYVYRAAVVAFQYFDFGPNGALVYCMEFVLQHLEVCACVAVVVCLCTL